MLQSALLIGNGLEHALYSGSTRLGGLVSYYSSALGPARNRSMLRASFDILEVAAQKLKVYLQTQ